MDLPPSSRAPPGRQKLHVICTPDGAILPCQRIEYLVLQDEIVALDLVCCTRDRSNVAMNCLCWDACMRALSLAREGTHRKCESDSDDSETTTTYDYSGGLELQRQIF